MLKEAGDAEGDADTSMGINMAKIRIPVFVVSKVLRALPEVGSSVQRFYPGKVYASADYEVSKSF